MKIKDIVLIGMMGAVLIAVQVAMAFLPNVELVSLLIILYTLIFGRKTVFIIYVFVLIQGSLYGMHLWWFSYLYIWTVLYTLTLLLRKERSPIVWALVSGFFGLSFGALCSIPYLVIGGFSTAIAFWVNGILFDISHGIANFIIALICFKPLYNLLFKLNSKFIQD